jgi:hypothetical protein
MPFCPQCHTPLRPSPEGLVTIADYYFAPLAYLGQMKLQSEGIASFVFDEYIINANWLYLIAIGRVKLKVAESDASESMKILQDAHEAIPEPAEDPEDGCPRCRSAYIRYDTFHLRRVFAVSGVSWIISPSAVTAFLLFFPFLKNKWKCNNCGYEWNTG